MNGIACCGEAIITFVFNEELGCPSSNDLLFGFKNSFKMEESYSVNHIAEGGTGCGGTADLNLVYYEEVSETITFQRNLPNNKILTYTAKQIWRE